MRLLATLPVLVLIVHLGVSWVSALAWAAVASTDFLDGWVARRQGATTSGAFLDPLADKVLVLGALAALAATGLASWIPVLLIAGREVAISVYRSSWPATGSRCRPGRWRRQDRGPGPGRGVILLPATGLHHPGIGQALLWISVGLALVSGAQYLLDSRRRRPLRAAARPRRPSRRRRPMRCEVLAIGTELLLGQVVDTNSAWIGEQLALAGIDSHLQVKVGDNQARIVAAIRQALARSDALICCGGLGPTQDDITREAIAEVLGVPLERRRGGGRPHRGDLRGPGPRHGPQQPAPGRGPPRRRPSSRRCGARRRA